MKNEKQKKCFVIMPFSVREPDKQRYYNDLEHWNEVYHGLIVPAIQEVGLRALRDDEDYSTRLVGEGVWQKIEDADMVLCDLSAHNPNAHLELGWTMRADKKLVLIKDDVTEFNFDLNQHYTFRYSHRLQPRILKNSVEELSKVILSTLERDVSRYSMLAKLKLQKKAADEVLKGSVEVGLLEQLMAEVRGMNKPTQVVSMGDSFNPITLDVTSKNDLQKALIGSTWRKDSGLEDITFITENTFAYTSVGTRKWHENTFSLDLGHKQLKLHWSQDDFVSFCNFDYSYSSFYEQDRTRWNLVAKKPYIHPSYTWRSNK